MLSLRTRSSTWRHRPICQKSVSPAPDGSNNHTHGRGAEIFLRLINSSGVGVVSPSMPPSSSLMPAVTVYAPTSSRFFSSSSTAGATVSWVG